MGSDTHLGDLLVPSWWKASLLSNKFNKMAILRNVHVDRIWLITELFTYTTSKEETMHRNL